MDRSLPLREWVARGVYVVLATALFSFPLLAALWLRADLFSVANESLAYRFLYSERLLGGDGTRVWVLAGFVTTAVQNLLLAAIDAVWGISRESLRVRIHAFAVGTSVLHCAGAALVFFLAARSRWLHWADRLLLALVGLGPLYLTRTTGFYYYTLPDYYLTNVVLALVATSAFQHAWRRPEDIDSPLAGALRGALCGVMVTNKITLAPLAALLLSPVLLADGITLRRVMGRLRMVAAGAVTAIAATLTLFYVFRINAPGRAFVPWLNTVLNPGGEAAFWRSAFPGYVIGQSYGYVMALWLVAMSLAVGLTWTRARSSARAWSVLTVNGLSSAAWCYFVYKRPAGTTFFEAAVMLFALIACALTIVAATKRGKAVAIAVVSLSSLFAFQAFSLNANLMFLRSSAAIADDMWRMHHELLAFANGRRIIVIHPDNEHGYGGVPEFLLKGAAQTPTWDVGTRGQRIIDRYAPGMTFRHHYGGLPPSAPLPPGAVVYWVDVSGRHPLANVYPALAVAESNGANRTRRWAIDYRQGGARIIGHAVVLNEPPPVSADRMFH